MEPKNKIKFEKPLELTKELAYLLGVYLGDGSTYSSVKGERACMFHLASIDREFVEITFEYIKKYIKVPPNRFIKVYPVGRIPKQRKTLYWLEFACTDFCQWLITETNHKTIVPASIPRLRSDLTRNFLEGFFDSEGSITADKKLLQSGYHKFYASIGNTQQTIIDEVADLLRLQGIKVGKRRVYTAPLSTKPFVQYNINAESLVTSRFQPRIIRKAANIKLCGTERGLFSSETTFNNGDIVNTSNIQIMDNDIVRPAAKVAELTRNS